jgi:hypothetical protein
VESFTGEHVALLARGQCTSTLLNAKIDELTCAATAPPAAAITFASKRGAGPGWPGTGRTTLRNSRG